MAAPATAVDVVNLALQQLYQSTITSLSDGSAAAQFASNCYDSIRQAYLRNFSMNFSNKRETAPLDTTYVIPFDYGYAYQIPNDVLMLRWVGFGNLKVHPLNYDIQDTHLLLDPLDWQGNPIDSYGGTFPWNSVNIKYTADVTDVSTMDPLFVQVLKWALAKELAMPISGNKEMAEWADEELKKAIAEAKAIQHIERPLKVIDVDQVALARLESSEIWNQVPIPSGWWGDVDAQ